MNQTKRKIFETSMKLFAKKGYDNTSVEEITSEVGVAKGTLYYHFASKEEIFEFLVKEGMDLLKTSIHLKTEKQDNCVDKIRAIIMIQIKIIIKYEDFMSIVMREVWGSGFRSKICQKYVDEYLEIIENLIKEGISKGEIKPINEKVLVSMIFGLASGKLYYKKNEEIDPIKLFKEIDKIFTQCLKG